VDIGYIWDENKYEKVLKERGIRFEDVVSALDDPEGYEQEDPNCDFEERWLYVGETTSGRILVVIFTEEDLPLYRIVTAFEAEGRWLDEYEKHRN
jgi:uncharacterized DUF497 family protein